MADVSQVLNQLTNFAYQVNGLIHPGAAHPPQYPPGMTSVPYPGTATPIGMPGDNLQLSRPATPPPPQQQPAPGAAGGFMAMLQNVFAAIASYFRRLFNPGAAVAAPANQSAAGSPAVPTPAMAWPANNPDAREQLFQMVPSGQGLAMGFVPVSVARYSDRLLASAAGYGQAAIVRQNGDFYFYEGNKPGMRAQQVTSMRQPNGDTHFDIALDGGKHIGVDLLGDGHTVRYKNFQLTLG